MKIRVIAILVSGFFAQTATAEVTEINLSFALQQALNNSPAVQAAKERLAEVEHTIGTAYANALPNLSGELSAAFRKDAANITSAQFGGEPYNSYGVALTVVQPLYTGGSLGAAIGGAKTEREIRTQDLRMAQRDVTVQTLRAFYGVLVQQRRIETLERSKATQKELLAKTQQRYGYGTSKLLEVLQAKTTLALLEPTLTRANNELAIRAAELSTLLRRPGGEQLRVTGTMEPTDWQALKTSMKEKQGAIPELERIRAVEEQAEHNKDFNLAKHLPQLNAVGQWGRNAFVAADILDDYSTSWNLMIRLQVPIFSSFSSVYERRRYNSIIQQANIEEIRVRDQFSLNQVKAERDIAAAQTVLESSRTALELAQQAMKEATNTYRLGTTTYQQFFDTQRNLTEAEFSADQAKYDYIIAQASFFNAVGWSLDPLLQQLAATPSQSLQSP